MDTRNQIHDEIEPAVLSVAFNHDSTRFICGMENGIRIFSSENCLRTGKRSPGLGQGIAIAETLDDRRIAIVGGGRWPNSAPSKLEFWDCWQDKMLHALDLREPVLGIRITIDYFLIILQERVVCMEYVQPKGVDLASPGKMLHLWTTGKNPCALCSISGDTVALPGQTAGQVQVVGLKDKTKRIIPAHTSSLRQIALSKDGALVATASEQGTLIRAFSTKTSKQTHEFRRGVENATIFSLAISPNNKFVASTSDKGTLHIFDIRPPSAEEAKPPPMPKRRGSNARPADVQRTTLSSTDFEYISMPSGSSSPMPTSGFYGPPADIAHTPPTQGLSFADKIAKLPGMPRAFTDARSITSVAYHMGKDPPNWQGQPAYTTTKGPNGQIENIKNPIIALPGRPGGKPPKGIIAWDPDSSDKQLWVVSGGADASWEVFELTAEEEGSQSLRVVVKGYRKYLTRQYVEDE